MIGTTRVALAALLLGSATLVAGQTPTQQFADQFRVLQSYTDGQPYRLSAPQFRNEPQDPATGLTTADLQPLSNGSPAWRPSPPPAFNGPTFAQANPHGLPFDYYQAAATDFDAFKYSPSASEPAFVTATGDSMFAGRQVKAMRVATDKAPRR